MALSLLPYTSVAYGDFIYFFVVLLSVSCQNSLQRFLPFVTP